MASPTNPGGVEASQPQPPTHQFFGLPRELQKEIISHVPESDLICLALANKHMRELATAELYRTFSFCFPDEDSVYDSPVDCLSSGLETFATSDYDYAQHLREIDIDTSSAGDKAELQYKQYLANGSCGKFLNILFLLVVRKAKALETLKYVGPATSWNVRIELSRPVYQALHKIDTLKHLHVRLQAGPSLYEAPPPLPLFSPISSPGSSTVSLPLVSNHASPITVLAGGSSGPWYIPYPASSLPAPPTSKYLKSKASKKSTIAKSPPTLSGFKDLQSLSVLDIDDLEIITELKSCIRKSRGTLSSLNLSFSTSLAMRARKPPPEMDPDDSDPEDEFQVVPVIAPPTSSYDDISGPAKIIRAQEERKTHEAVLGRIFDVEPYLVKKPTLRPREAETEPEPAKDEQNAAPASDFINSMRAVSSKLMKELNGSDDFTSSQQEILDTIEAAARKYVAEETSKKTEPQQEQENGESSTHVVEGEKAAVTNEEVNGNGVANAQQTETSLFEEDPSASKENQQESNPDDIDIEAPVEDMPEDLDDVEMTEDLDDVEMTKDLDDVEMTKGSNELPVPKTAYWSVAEQDNFPNLLKRFGTDWNKVAAHMRTKTPTMVRNFYTRRVHNGYTEWATMAEEANRNPRGLKDPLEENDDVDDEGSSPTSSTAGVDLDAQQTNFKTLGEKLQFFEIEAVQLQKEINSLDLKAGPEAIKRFSALEQQSATVSENIKEIMGEMASVAAEIDYIMKKKGINTADADLRQRINEYTVATRGISVHTLCISLIPVKASVLSRAIDLRVLRNLTLLNVGNQAPIWSLLTKENKTQELPLRKIFTDNVSMPFLTCVSQLKEVVDLFMLERSEKYKPETFAPKSTVTIESIRRLALKKHQNTLKRLMIKNQNDVSWDADTKTMLLLSKFKVLEELAVSMGIREIHILLQNIHLMVNLRALHIVNLRNDDTCVFVMRETKHFIIDSLCHFQDLKLEWLAIDEDEHAEHLLRYKSPPKTNKKAKGKGKQKETNGAALSTVTNGGQYPVLSLEPGLESDSDDDDDVAGSDLRIEMDEHIHFYDICDVTIFSRNVVSARL